MKVYVSDIDKAMSCYQPSQSWFGPPKLEPTLIAQLKNFRANLGPATGTPLSPADLFHLCKILVSTQEDLTNLAIRKHFENVIGIEKYRVLKSLYQSGGFNAYYFNLVLNPPHKLFSERWPRFINPDLWRIIDLLTRANILDNSWNQLWDWLTRVDQPRKLSLLRQIVERLSSQDLLHIRYFPIFSSSRCLPIDQGSFHLKNYFRKLQDAAEIGLRLISLARYQQSPMFFSVLQPEVIRMIACAGTTYGTYTADEAGLLFDGLSNPLP